MNPDRAYGVIRAQKAVAEMGEDLIFSTLARDIDQCKIKLDCHYHNRTPTGLRWKYAIQHPVYGDIDLWYDTATRTARA